MNPLPSAALQRPSGKCDAGHNDIRRRRFPERVAALLAGLLAAMALAAIVAGAVSAPAAAFDRAELAQIEQHAAALPRLHALIVAHRGTVGFERAFRGPRLDSPANVKSVAKSIVSALAGIAIDRGLVDGPDVPVAALLPAAVPARADPRLARITLGNLLSMQAGLERTSGRNYGRWVQSADWVRFALSRPFVDAPGGRMLYSTGNSHVVSAILTKRAGRSTLELARDWLAAPLGIDLPAWPQDPQGIYFGGNDMLLSPRALLRFGEMYRNGGLHDGVRVVSESWIRASWTRRTASHYSGDAYGYGWFIAEACGEPVYYARGFGGQFVYVAPAHGLTIVVTSAANVRTRVDGYYEALRALVFDAILPAAAPAGCASLAPISRERPD